MKMAARVFGFIFIAVGIIRLIVDEFSGITAPGLDTVNLSMIHGSIVNTIGGYAFVIIGMQFLILSSKEKDKV